MITKAVQLIGDSAEQSIIALDGHKGSPLEIHGTKGVVIESLGFEHDGTESVTNGPPLVRVEDGEVTFRKCAFNKSAGDAVIVGDKGNVQAEDCRFEQNALAGLRAAAGGIARLKAPILRSNDVGIFAGGEQSKVTSEGGEFQGQAHHGVEVSSGAQVTLKNVKISDSAECGLYAHDPGSAITASDATVTKCKEGMKVTDGAALTLTDCISEANTVGIGARNAGAVSLTGGRSTGNSLHGVVIESDSKSGTVLMSGMTVKSNAGVGLFVAGAEMKPDVAGNDFGPNGQLDILVRNGASGRFAKNTLRTGPDYRAFLDSNPDWQPDNEMIPQTAPK
jgi:hypothetical protein